MILTVGNIFRKELGDNRRFIVDTRAGYDFKHDDNTITSELLGTQIAPIGIDNNGFIYKLGLSYQIENLDTLLNFGYDLQGEGRDFQSHVISAQYIYKF
jgi:hypothetical protein